MKKLMNFLMKCLAVLMVCLILTNIVTPPSADNGFGKEPEYSTCTPTQKPDENPFGDGNE